MRRSPSGATLLDFDGAAIDKTRKSLNTTATTEKHATKASESSSYPAHTDGEKRPPSSSALKPSTTRVTNNAASTTQNATTTANTTNVGQQQQQQAAPSISLPRQRGDAVKHFALDLGGSLIKLVYFSANSDTNAMNGEDGSQQQTKEASSKTTTATLGGRLHFRRFPSSSLKECLDFIERKKLHYSGGFGQHKSEIKATGGGSFKHQRTFRDALGIELQKEDEMACAVRGANFLLKTIRDEAFTFENDTKTFVDTNFNVNNFNSTATTTGGASGSISGSISGGGGIGGGGVESHSYSASSSNSSSNNLFPYLLVNIGSGVSIIKVTETGHERISGSNIGGGTFWGLCRLLTGMRDYDEMLKCSQNADSARVDMLVGDIYGRDYAKVGLSSDVIASSFGRVVMEEGDLSDYSKADITLSLLRMISYNIAHLATMNAKAHGLQRIFFGGYFIRGHAYTMNTISFAVNFWSKGETKAMFLRHEGFLGALGAFLSDTTAKEKLGAAETRGSWIEKFIKYSTKAASEENNNGKSGGGKSSSPPLSSLRRSNSYTSSGENVLAVATAALHIETDGSGADSNARAYSLDGGGAPRDSLSGLAREQPAPRHNSFSHQSRHRRGYSNLSSHLGVRAPPNDFDVGVLHYAPLLEPYPLLQNPESYVPDTFDLQAKTTISAEDREYWLMVLKSLTAGVAERARDSELENHDEEEHEKSSARASLDEHHAFVNYDAYDFESNNNYRKKTPSERAEQFRNAYDSLLDRLLKDPFGCGKISLSSLFEAREECLRDCGFADAYADVKQRENDAALVVLPELLEELEQMEDESQRLIQIVEGVLAGNVFDWGSQACVDLYNNGTILDIYKAARKNATRLSWKIDGFEEFAKKLSSNDGYKKAHIFVDNSGADIVLGVLPFVVELLRRGTEVVLVANALPALNDVTADELSSLLDRAAETCGGILKSALYFDEDEKEEAPREEERATAKLSVVSSGNGGPCIDLRRASRELIEASENVDLVVLEGMGRAVHTNYNAEFVCDSLKLAMIKNARLAERLCRGEMFDCVVRFDDPKKKKEIKNM